MPPDAGRTPPRRLAWFAGAVLLLLGCDQGTKQVAKTQLESGPPRVLLSSVLDLRYTENTDVGFNLLRALPASTRRPLIVGLACLTVLALSLWAYFERRKATADGAPQAPRSLIAPWRLPLVLFVAGALGNLLDRVFRGYVIDFLHINHWPVFNVADIYLTLAIALLALGMWPTLGKRLAR